MSYSDFTIKQVQHNFGLEIIEKFGIFSTIESVAISDYFTVTLEENIPLAVSMNTEKAKSELIISNVLIEVRKLFDRKISFFSGVEFNIDKEKGLNGYCDFLISLSAEQLFVKSPVIALVEAKNDNIMGGLGQCIAEMIAAQIFNETEGNTIASTYGAVTTGIFWKFIKLTKNTVHIDLKDYSIEENPERIIGILSAMMQQKA
ncbi:MAG: hypothetical protein WAX77_14360 [Methylococcaceae bacterium]